MSDDKTKELLSELTDAANIIKKAELWDSLQANWTKIQRENLAIREDFDVNKVQATRYSGGLSFNGSIKLYQGTDEEYGEPSALNALEVSEVIRLARVGQLKESAQ